MLIYYIRTPRQYEAKVVYTPSGVKSELVEKGGNPYGVIISTERGKVGWAICGPGDRYNKEKGMRIAQNRIDFYGTDKEAVLQDAPDSIKGALLKMYDRSNRYYK